MAKKFKTRKNTQNKPHLIIDAGPGCGKSTTTVAALGIMAGVKPKWYKSATDEQKAIWDAMDGTYHSIGFQAFNKSIAVELQSKLPPSVDAKTFHSFGYAVLKANGYKTKMTQDNVGYMLKDMLGYGKDERMSKEHWDLLVVVKKVVSLLKNNLFDATKENVLHVVKYNNIEVNGNIDQIVKFAKQVFDKTLKIEKGQFQWIDFDDMIWLPIALNMDFTSVAYDLLVCDESQDLNPVQHELIVRSGVRLVCVGDPRQAIYGFRGADSKSMTTLEELLGKTKRGVEVLPLQVSFRLPKSAVANVNAFAPDLKALPDAIEGEILDKYVDEIEPKKGDLIVSRINANIFSLAFQLLKKRIPVRIQGREFGNQLIKIIKDNCEMGDGIESALAAIQEFDSKERDRLAKKTFGERLIDAHSEKVSCLYSLADGCKMVSDMIRTIEQLFSNTLKTEDVVLLSTVHRAKGLEAKTVYFLEPELVPHPMAKLESEKEQEYNLKFVAETRHMETLVYVHERKDEDSRDREEGRELQPLASPNEVFDIESRMD